MQAEGIVVVVVGSTDVVVVVGSIDVVVVVGSTDVVVVVETKSKIAVTVPLSVILSVIVSVQLSIPEHPPPLQPVKASYLESAVAVKVTSVPCKYASVQSLPQLILLSTLATVPAPVPVCTMFKVTAGSLSRAASSRLIFTFCPSVTDENTTVCEALSAYHADIDTHQRIRRVQGYFSRIRGKQGGIVDFGIEQVCCIAAWVSYADP